MKKIGVLSKGYKVIILRVHVNNEIKKQYYYYTWIYSRQKQQKNKKIRKTKSWAIFPSLETMEDHEKHISNSEEKNEMEPLIKITTKNKTLENRILWTVYSIEYTQMLNHVAKDIINT